jgi:hypothetical protein
VTHADALSVWLNQWTQARDKSAPGRRCTRVVCRRYGRGELSGHQRRAICQSWRNILYLAAPALIWQFSRGPTFSDEDELMTPWWLLPILLCACATQQPQQRPQRAPLADPVPSYCCPPVQTNKAYNGDGIAADGNTCTREYLMALGPYSRDELVNFMNSQRARSIYILCMESKGWQQVPPKR